VAAHYFYGALSALDKTNKKCQVFYSHQPISMLVKALLCERKGVCGGGESWCVCVLLSDCIHLLVSFRPRLMKKLRCACNLVATLQIGYIGRLRHQKYGQERKRTLWWHAARLLPLRSFAKKNDVFFWDRNVFALHVEQRVQHAIKLRKR
jgi:hypothetical protein